MSNAAAGNVDHRLPGVLDTDKGEAWKNIVGPLQICRYDQTGTGRLYR